MSSYFGIYGKGTDKFKHKKYPDVLKTNINEYTEISWPDTAEIILNSTLNDDVSYYQTENYIILLRGKPRWRKNNQQGSCDIAFMQQLSQEYPQSGTDILATIGGGFALTILEKQSSSILLAVDRMGTYGLYYSSVRKGGVIFSSSLRDLLTVKEVEKDIDCQSIFNYIYFHVIPSPRTIFTSVNKLEAGQYILIKGSKIDRNYFWLPKTNYSQSISSDLQKQLAETLESSVKRSAVDTKATFLSGGLDSSTITGLAAKCREGDVDAFSIGFDAEGYDEMPYAELAAKHFSVRHHKYYVTPSDVLETLPIIVDAYGEPFGNSSAIPVYYCAKMAKEMGHDMMLAGDGGDELFAGNERYIKQKQFEQYYKIPKFFREQFIEPVARNVGVNSNNALTRKAASYVRQALVKLPDRLQTYNFLSHFDTTEIFAPEFLSQISDSEPIECYRSVYARFEANHYLDSMLMLDWKYTLAENDLPKVTEMCNVAGVGVRYPMLDDGLVDLSLRIPPDQKLPSFKLRDFYKKTFIDLLPRQILHKKKHGFGLPFGVWMKSYKPLQEFAYDNISALAQRDYFNSEYLKKLITLHSREHASYYGEMIWILTIFELWLSKLSQKSIGNND